MEYLIREMREEEYPMLRDFTYECLYVHEGEEPFPRSILDTEEMQVYMRDFGKKKDDFCYIVEVDGEIAGAVWVRDMDDYGHIAAGVPSFAIALFEEYRDYGIGTALMKTMLSRLDMEGYERASLSVQTENFATEWYRKLGFEVYEDKGKEYIMVYHFRK